MPAHLSIDVAFDPICPWCLIGKRHLARALALLAQTEPDVAVQVRWLPVQLLPDLPEEGVPFAEFYVRRLGSPQAVLARQLQVHAAAKKAGLQIDFSRITRMPNTRLALRLLDYASAAGSVQQHDAVVEQLFGAHFLQDRNIGDMATLVALARACGLDGLAVHALLSNTAATASAVPHRPTAREGVPHFVFNGRYGLSGAHPPKALLHAMLQALGRNVRQEECAT